MTSFAFLRASRLLAVTLLGSFAWDRLCVAAFAPQILAAQLREAAALRVGDFWGPKAPTYLGWALAAAAWLYFTEGNMVLAAMAYYVYSKALKKPTAETVGGAVGAGGGQAGAPAEPHTGGARAGSAHRAGHERTTAKPRQR